MSRHFCFLILVATLLLGCNQTPPTAKDDTSATSQVAPNGNEATTELEKQPSAVAKAKLSKDSSTIATTGLGVRAAIGQLQTRIEESVAGGPTSVIWVIDVSKSTERLRGEVLSMITAVTTAIKKNQPEADLLTGLVSASAEAKWELEPTGADPEALEGAVAKLMTSSSPKENLFSAIRLASEKAVEARRKSREAMIILVTDEAGDDGDTVDEVLTPLKKFSIPVFVLGNPAPFGRASVSAASIEASDKQVTDIDPTVMHEGPETIEPEVIDLSFNGSDASLELYDAGFGPFFLEKLCRVSGGRYLALRHSAGDGAFTGIEIRWPDPSAMRFSPEKMQAYAPEYGSRAEYQSLLESNKAAKTLTSAAKLPRIATLGAINVRFDKANEAQMKRRLDESQEAAAKIEPNITRLVELLLPGESDRDKLPSVRWKAGFDLALGRALAAKARVDGYNSMLAVLKRGKNFQNPASKSWRLQAGDDATEAGSSIQAMVKKSNMLLSRVIKEHPETPWAEMAKRELETPLGWKWVEE